MKCIAALSISAVAGRAKLTQVTVTTARQKNLCALAADRNPLWQVPEGE